MFRIVAAVALMTGSFAMSQASSTEWQGEFLAPTANAGMVLGWINPRDPTMREFVPRGENVQSWTRMLTVQTLPWRMGLTPTGVLRMLANGMEGACAGATSSPIEATPLDGRDGATIRVDCPRNPQTGKAETMFARAVQGDRSITMVQAAMRRVPAADDIAWATKALSSLSFCGETDQSGRCGTLRGGAVGKPL